MRYVLLLTVLLTGCSLLGSDEGVDLSGQWVHSEYDGPAVYLALDQNEKHLQGAARIDYSTGEEATYQVSGSRERRAFEIQLAGGDTVQATGELVDGHLDARFSGEDFSFHVSLVR